MLKNIHRRKLSQVQLTGQFSGPLLEDGRIESQVEKLKVERKSLMQEVVNLQQENELTTQQVESMTKRLMAAEGRQQQMLTFLAKILQNPSFIAYLKGRKEQKPDISSRLKKKYLKHQEACSSRLNESSMGQLVSFTTGRTEPGTILDELDQTLDAGTGEQIPSYLVHDFVRSLELDEEDVMLLQNLNPPKQLQDLADALDDTCLKSLEFPLVDPVSSSDADKLVSFVDDSSLDKMHPPFVTSACDSIVKQEEVQNLHLGSGHPSSSQDVWETMFSSNVQESDIVSELGLWEMELGHTDQGMWIDELMGDPTFDSLESKEAN